MAAPRSDLVHDPLDEALAAGTAKPGKVGAGQWMALTAALLGWMFDGAEMGVFSMVGGAALSDLMPDASAADVNYWFGVIIALFLVGAATGGVLFGWLGDRIGRVRAMTLSVLVYAVFTGLCGITSEAWQLGALRFVAALGMGGEWSLGVALVMEVWPNRSRAFMAGLIGAAANVGYLLVGVIGLVLHSFLDEMQTLMLKIGMPDNWVETLVHNQGWRLLMIFGTLPALLTFFIRIFVPESEKWQHEAEKGNTSNWETKDLWGVVIGALGPILIVYVWSVEYLNVGLQLLGSAFGLVIAAAGYIYPVRRYIQRQAHGSAEAEIRSRGLVKRMLLAACLSGVALLGTWAGTQWIPKWANTLTDNPADNAKYHTQMWLAFGAIVGTISAAIIGDWIGRRLTYTLMCITAFFSVWGVFQLNDHYGPQLLVWTFVSGVLTASFYGWLPLYLPELFHTSVRATGQGFSYNFGRILAAVGALQAAKLTGAFPNEVSIGNFRLNGGVPFACCVMSAIYLLGVIVIWFLPETKGKPLPE